MSTIKSPFLYFSSEVLFSVGSAYLGSRGKTEISKVADIINQIADEIPTGIDWILRVDGHRQYVHLLYLP